MKIKYLAVMLMTLLVWGSALAGKTVTIEQGMAQPIKFEGSVTEIFVSNPEIADFQMNQAKTAYVFGKTPGQTTMIALDSKGKQLMNMTVVVTHNIEQLTALIREAAPNDFVQVRSVPGGLVLEGTVESPGIAQNLKEIAERYLGENQVLINHLGVKAPVQVNLRVKVAEVNRTVLNNFGINWRNFFTPGNFAFGFLSGRAPNDAGTTGAVNVTQITEGKDPLTALAASFQDGNNDINTVLDALAKEQLVTILAEPNLVAVSGETASFLAGGEFPYPVPQDDGTITIEFKQFGVSLSFTPTVLGDKLISMRVRPEVSELDETRETNLGRFPVPGITTRRAETSVELASGQSFAIAGLLKNTVSSSISGTPGLADVPILGSLFRSNGFNRGETELVIIVTPYLVNPVSGKELALPTDGLNYASFVEQIFERRLTRENPQRGMAPPIGGSGVRLIGPAGFSIE